MLVGCMFFTFIYLRNFWRLHFVLFQASGRIMNILAARWCYKTNFFNNDLIWTTGSRSLTVRRHIFGTFWCFYENAFSELCLHWIWELAFIKVLPLVAHRSTLLIRCFFFCVCIMRAEKLVIISNILFKKLFRTTLKTLRWTIISYMKIKTLYNV